MAEERSYTAEERGYIQEEHCLMRQWFQWPLCSTCNTQGLHFAHFCWRGRGICSGKIGLELVLRVAIKKASKYVSNAGDDQRMRTVHTCYKCLSFNNPYPTIKPHNHKITIYQYCS